MGQIEKSNIRETTCSYSISVVIPVFNRYQLLKKTLYAFSKQTLPYDQFEIIVVDDGSTDDSWEYICKAQLPQIEINGIRLSRNFGKEAALCAGLEVARGEAVVTIDGDLQHPPELIPTMLQ